MGRYLVRRFLEGLLVVFLASIVIFLIIRLIPGDPAQQLAGEDATLEDVERIREQLGLNDPTLALSSGELDMAYDVPTSWYAGLVEDDEIDVKLAPPTSLLWAMGMVGTGRGGGHESLDRDYFDVDEARRLISEAGYADGTPTFKIACISFQQEALQMAQIIQQDAAQAGINVEPEAMEFSAWLDSFLAGTHEALYVALFSFFAMHPQTLPVMNYQMRIPNSCAYDSPEYQAMIDGWPTADSEAKRQALLDEFNSILDQEPWIAPICTTATLWASRSNVKGFWDDVTGRARLMDVYFDDT